jgi:hypothetical protein
VGWVRLSQRPVERRARLPLARAAVQRLVRAALLTLACGLLASCGSEPILAPPADLTPQKIANTPVASIATPVATPEAPRVGGVVWATNTDPATNVPIDQVTNFHPDALRIVAAVHVDALSAGSYIEATWEYNDTSLDAFTTRLPLSDSGTDQWISFYIERDPEVEWPVGTYEVSISVDGVPVQQAAVEVREES